MPRLSPDEKRAAILKKQAELDAQLRSIDAKVKERARKEDTRRKVIAGALILEHLEKSPADPVSRKMRELLEKYVEPRARYLFPIIATPGSQAETTKVREAAE